MDQNIHPFQTQNSEQLKFNVEEFGSQTAFEKAVDPFFHDTTKWLVILVPPGCHKLLSFLRFHLQSQRHDGTSQKHVIIVVQLLRNSVSKWNMLYFQYKMHYNYYNHFYHWNPHSMSCMYYKLVLYL